MYSLYSAVIELTRKCNARCKHCIIDAGKEKDNELSTSQIMKLLEDLADLGCKVVTFTGGEALLREEWPLFLQKAKSLDMTTVVMTNGLLLTDENIKILSYFNTSVGISLDGSKAETHDGIRGVRGLFDNFKNIVPKLLENDIYFTVATTVMQTNYNELEELNELLLDLKVPTWQIQVVKPSSRMDKNEILTEEQYYNLAKKIIEFRKIDGENMKVVEADCIGYHSSLTKDLLIQKWTGCECGINVVCIESDGNVKGCPNMNNSEGNIQERPFIEIWQDHNSFKYNRCPSVESLTGYCKECQYKYVCRGGCPTNAKTQLSNSAYCLHKIEAVGADK